MIEVAVGQRVRLLVRSADGVHGVGIRKFKVNTLVPAVEPRWRSSSSLPRQARSLWSVRRSVATGMTTCVARSL